MYRSNQPAIPETRGHVFKNHCKTAFTASSRRVSYCAPYAYVEKNRGGHLVIAARSSQRTM